jgi:release factor glutamine methyltransferase
MAPKRDRIARMSDTVFHKEVYEPAEVRRLTPTPTQPRAASPRPRRGADYHLLTLAPSTPSHPGPSQDSYLLVDTLVAEWDARLVHDPPRCALEVGSGTGYVITSAAILMRDAGVQDFQCHATDCNPDAVACTAATATKHGVDANLTVTQCDLLGPLAETLRGTVDLMLFNPPYVLTPSEEVGSNSIAAAWAGGKDGREVLDRLLPHVFSMLSPGGTFLLLLLHDNKPHDVAAILSSYGLVVDAIVATASADEERLHVLRAVKPK